MDEKTRHPFLKGLSKHRGAPPTVLVIFGASGDLTARKLVPGLYNLGLDNLLPNDFAFVGFARSEMEDEAFRKVCDEGIDEHSRRPRNEDVWGRIRERVYYHQGQYDELEAYERLATRLKELEDSMGRELQYMFYISTPPRVFEAVLDNLGASGLGGHRRDNPQLCSRIVIEKPFGYDLSTARALNETIARQFDENQVYRIDHYLGKETVQDLLVQRFANAIFEPVWNRNYVESVQITVAEASGVGSRAGYYDRSGALRDMIQNHTMQLVALTAMEPPVSLDPEAIRNEKVKVLKAIQPLKLEGAKRDVVRARYSEGLENGKPVRGYEGEEDVPADSHTETYAALRLAINNWRWKGVPFYIRSGKRMAKRVSEIAVQFKRPPGVLFMEKENLDVAENTMVFRIQPDEGVTLVLNAKVPGLETRTQPVKMNFGYSATFGSNTPEAYERLLLDAMVGDSTLFIRGDETEASWSIITPILEYWKECEKAGLETYAAGTWGPLEADQLTWQTGHKWRKPGA